MALRFDASQQLRTGQHLRLKPKMIQSMEILQLPLAALEERIERELESNVALELTEPEPAVAADGESGGDGPESGGDDPTAQQFERLRRLERTYGEQWDGDRRASRRFDGERDGKLAAMENAPSRGESLEEQLEHQWRLVEAPEELKTAGRRLLEFIDDDGLLRTSLEDILDQSRSLPGAEWTMELLERALARLQRELDPPGLAGRDVRESLLLQIQARLREADDQGSAQAWLDARELVEHHFDDLLHNRLPKIASSSSLDLDRIRTARERLRSLSIAPGGELVEVAERPVRPDVVIEYDPTNDRYVAALQSGSLPSLRISPQYRQMARDRSVDKDTRRFVSEGVRSATWLIDSINQRRNTLLRVVEAVVARQREFLDHGPHFLKPMPMIDVADELALHVGTISRAVSEKWVQTPRGVFPLRKLFSGGLETDSGEDRSWEAVKAKLKEVVEAEDRTRPLSDRAIAEALEKEGIRIARRTVVKYREQMGIPSARQRREHR